MYSNHLDQQILPGEFFLPFGGRLNEKNRWVQLSYLIPRDGMMDKTSWDSFNEGTTLIESVGRYVERFGYYTEAIRADKIYRTRENLRYCKVHGIRMSGPKLGRPPKTVDPEQEKLERQDMGECNAVEGKFGEGKRNYGLGLIQTRLRQTSETVIALQLLMMNLDKRLRLLSWLLFEELLGMDFDVREAVS